MSLAGFQQEFLGAVRSPQPAAERGIEVYRRAHQAIATEALGAAYPVVRRLVGDGFFEALAARYDLQHPSRSGDLAGYGAHLASFVAADAPSLALPYLPDVARLEWAIHRLGGCADPAPFDFASLAALSPGDHERVKFGMSPAAVLMGFAHPASALWEANAPERDGSYDGPWDGEAVLVVRGPAAVHCHRLEPAVATLVERLAAGLTLGHALGGLDPETAGALPRLVEWGAFERAWA